MAQPSTPDTKEQSISESLLAKSCAAIATAISSRNVVSLAEFNQFERMFDPGIQRRAIDDTLSAEEKQTLEELCIQFKDRFDIQSVIYIVDDGKIVRVITPVIGRLDEIGNVVSDSLSEKIVNTIETMVRINQDTTSNNPKLGDAISSLNTVMDHAITPGVKSRNEIKANEFRTKLQMGNEDIPRKEASVLTNMEWE